MFIKLFNWHINVTMENKRVFLRQNAEGAVANTWQHQESLITKDESRASLIFSLY